ncbi:TPA: hypothetical protein ACHF2V_002193 [Citrobacter farmeri]|uniref:Uncharacterized protein n=1 Tax=Salmonella enterica subsp. enterica serovar Sandiego TaxID=1151002 RepID=A0A607IEN4_SALET|nr:MULTISPECIES: hypothetical protein [Enterobacter cloacae complex]ECU8979877.1 hypothetical protein [Salmonella enterica subsp. enterica serovar Sandiego]EFA4814006.1 hypothetical protein [Escherichia coli]EMB4683346.1 hypothetical protein [Klebsiella pneumoniae]HCI6143140.1 hypothetical protein [Klebsiella variicola subsp. variicola]EFJ4024029.1 hypothetical protein [Escherichia coli]
MSVVEVLREYSEVWKLFGQMPDSATVNSELASVFLGISIKTLARYRQNGGGPPYIQYQAEDTKARNQRVLYVLGDLRVWRDIHKVSSSMHGAQVRGLAFTSLTDFIEEHPFIVRNKIIQKRKIKRLGVSKSETEIYDDVILGHILCVEETVLTGELSNNGLQVIWISIEEALKKHWEHNDDKNVFLKCFKLCAEEIITNAEIISDYDFLKQQLR